MKNAPHDGAGRGADGADVLAPALPSFRVTSFAEVSYGSKVGELTVEIDGVGRFDCDLFRPAGRDPFVAPRSVRSKFSGAYERTFKLDDDLVLAILRAIEHRDDDGSVTP